MGVDIDAAKGCVKADIDIRMGIYSCTYMCIDALKACLKGI